MDLRSVPPALRALVAGRKCELRGQYMVDWRALAQAPQDSLDHLARYDVRRTIAQNAAEFVEVEVDDTSQVGRRWRGRLYAMNEHDFWELLYAAYREGQSSARFPILSIKEHD